MGKEKPSSRGAVPAMASAGFSRKGVGLIRFFCVILLLLNLLVLLGIFFSSHGIPGHRLKSGQVTELEAKVLALQKENQQLYRKIMNFKNDPRAQERLVREHLGWAREDEVMIEFHLPGRSLAPAEPGWGPP